MRVLLLLLVLTATARANAPAPWAVCYGKKAGDSCSSIYYPFGKCVVDDAFCKESKECIYCRTRSGCEIGAGDTATGAALLGFGALVLLFFRRGGGGGGSGGGSVNPRHRSPS